MRGTSWRSRSPRSSSSAAPAGRCRVARGRRLTATRPIGLADAIQDRPAGTARGPAEPDHPGRSAAAGPARRGGRPGRGAAGLRGRAPPRGGGSPGADGQVRRGGPDFHPGPGGRAERRAGTARPGRRAALQEAARRARLVHEAQLPGRDRHHGRGRHRRSPNGTCRSRALACTYRAAWWLTRPRW